MQLSNCRLRQEKPLWFPVPPYLVCPAATLICEHINPTLDKKKKKNVNEVYKIPLEHQTESGDSAIPFPASQLRDPTPNDWLFPSLLTGIPLSWSGGSTKPTKSCQLWLQGQEKRQVIAPFRLIFYLGHPPPQASSCQVHAATDKLQASRWKAGFANGHKIRTMTPTQTQRALEAFFFLSWNNCRNSSDCPGKTPWVWSARCGLETEPWAPSRSRGRHCRLSGTSRNCLSGF